MRYIKPIIGLIFCIIASSAWATGTVKMQGSIIETPCIIDMDSRDQTIDMGSLPVTYIIRNGQGPSRSFSIRLINCALERPNKNQGNWQYLRVTFDGPHTHGLFDVNGQAKGVGLQIQRKNDGAIIIPGKGMLIPELQNGTNNLIYQLRLVANNHTLVSGIYNSQLRFKLDYE